jgi:hypothetical protein
VAGFDLLTAVITDPQRVTHSLPLRGLMRMLCTFQTVSGRWPFTPTLTDRVAVLRIDDRLYILHIAVLANPPSFAYTVVEQIPLGVRDSSITLIRARTSAATFTLRVSSSGLAAVDPTVVTKPPIMTAALPRYILIRVFDAVVTLFNRRTKSPDSVRIARPSID